MARTKQSCGSRFSGISLCPPTHSTTPTHRSITDKNQRLKLGLSIKGDTRNDDERQTCDHSQRPVRRPSETSTPPLLASRHQAVLSLGGHSKNITDLLRARVKSAVRSQAAIFTFTLLPSEIRHEIYALLLTSRQPLAFTPPTTNDVRNKFIAHLSDDFPSFSISILSVCKAIYAEALPVLYGKNMFSFFIGTRGSPATDFDWGPTPYNTALAFQPTARPTLSLMRNVQLSIVTERSSNSQHKSAMLHARLLNSWIAELTGRLSFNRTQPIRSLVVDFKHRVHLRFGAGSVVVDSTIELEPDERVLNGLFRLYGVREVLLKGDMSSAYKEALGKQLMSAKTHADWIGVKDGTPVGRYVLRRRLSREVL